MASPPPDVRADFPVLRAGDQRPPARLPRLGRDVAEAAPGDRDDGALLPYPTATCTAASTSSAREATEQFEGARERIAAFVGWDPTCTIFTRNATEAINLVAYRGAAHNLGPGDEVLITEMEHHSNIVPWQLACEETGARLRYLSVSDGGELSLDELDSVLAGGKRQAGRRRARLQRARHDQPGRGDRRRARAAGAVSWSTARRLCRRCRSTWRDRRRLLRLDRAQGARAPPRAAARPARAAPGDAAVPRRRPHDLARRARALDLERAALEVRGRHQRDRRGDRPRRGGRLPRRDRDGARARARARADRLRARAAARRRGRHAVRPDEPTGAAAWCRSRSRGCTPTTSPSCATARRSACAPATTARSR